MKIAPYVDKLLTSDKYKDFMEENPKSQLVAGFFVLDLQEGKNVHQLDYYVPDKKKIAAFTLDGEVIMQLLSIMDSGKPLETLDINTKVDLDAIQGILEDEMLNRNITEKLQKIIAVVQTLDGKKTWTLNCMLTGMHILHAKIEDESRSVLSMNKASLFDFIKKVPKEEIEKIKAKAKEKEEMQKVKGEEQEDEEGEEPKPMENKEDIKEEIKKLDKLESEIEEEKKELKEELSKSEDNSNK